MILFITERPETFVPLSKDQFFRGAYQSYFFYQCFSQGLSSSDIKLLFIDNFDKKKLDKNIDIIIPLGKEVWKRFNSSLSLDKARGSVFEENFNGNSVLVIPTFHPEELKMPYRMFMDSSVEKSYCFRQDIRKSKDILVNGFNRPSEQFNITPTIQEVRDFVKFAKKEQPLLGTDIEAVGLNIEYASLVCIGFAWNDSECIVIPFTKEGGAMYWQGADMQEIDDLLNDLFKSCQFMFQNGIGYDVPLLRERGYKFPLTSFTDDTMLMHHSINPELPHNIGFISSFYGQQPYWKHEFLIKKVHIWDMDQLEMRKYNARDCVALHQIYWPMKRELEEKELEDVYGLAMKLCPAIIEMQENGLLIDQNKLRSWQRFLDKEIKETFEQLQKNKILPTVFNYASGDHLTWLFYGIKTVQFKKIDELTKWERHNTYGYRCLKCDRKINLKLHYTEKAFDEIESQCPKCKTTQWFHRTKDPVKISKPKSKTSEDYKKLKILEIIAKIKPFIPPSQFAIPTTASGYGTDKVAITKYIIAINKRLEELQYLKRKSEKHDKENINLTKTLKFLIQYQKYSALLKLKNSFYSFKHDSKGHRMMWQDGRVRPKMLIQGTATGRFSCKSPNLQQAPAHGIGSKMREIFSAGPGKTFLSIDFSNLEVQVGARFMNDEVLIELLEKGKNMHDENTKIFFATTKANRMWKDLRFASKKIMFGRLLYGGSDNGIYAKVMTEVPGCGLTLKKFKEAVQNYMASHPSYVKWVDKMIKLAHTERISINAYGRKRYLYGDSSKIERQALNTPIQGSSADTINQDIVLIYQELLKQGIKTKMALAVHDELIFECLDSELKQVYEIAKKIMKRERIINGHTFTIPIDSEIGKYWGSLSKFNEETMETIDGSKH